MSQAEQSGFYTADGLLRGSYIYLLMCQKGKHIFIKVGRSENPERRIRELATGCAVKPELLCTMRLPSRRATVKAETALHHALEKWWSHGEWFCVDVDEKSAFNVAIRSVVTEYQKPGWPVSWDKIPVQPLLSALAKQASESKRLYRQHGITTRTDAPFNY
jgi:hypothetical protein